MGDLPGAYAHGVKGKDGLGKLQRGPPSGGKDPGMEIAFPYVGNFEVLHGAGKGEEVAGVVAVGACRMCLQIYRPLLPHEVLQKVPQQLLEFRLERLYHLITNAW